jgi:signal transduction histidine kinase
VIERMRVGGAADYQVETVRKREDGEVIDVWLSCSPIRDPGGALTAVSLIARDITQRKRAERALAERARLAAMRADVGLALARNDDLHSSLQSCTEVIVEHTDAAFARIWVVDPKAQVLELRASAGLSVDLDGPDTRVPLGASSVGRIAQQRMPLVTNDAMNDAQTADRDWLAGEHIVSFAGFPLVVTDRVVGVLALASRHPLAQNTVDDLRSISFEIAQRIERARAEESSRRYAEQLERANDELRESVERRKVAEDEARAAVDRRDRFLAILSHELRNPLAAISNASQLLDRAELRPDLRRQAQAAISRQSRLMTRLLDDLLDVSRITRNRIDIHKEPMDLCESAREAIELVRGLAEAREQTLSIDLPAEPVPIDGDPARLQQVQVNLLTNAIKYTPHGGRIDFSVRRLAPDGRMSGRHPDALDGLRVVLVEDNADIRETTARPLATFGCDVVEAEDGSSGIDAVEKNGPHVALIDIGMPGMNGHEVAQRLRIKHSIYSDNRSRDV